MDAKQTAEQLKKIISALSAVVSGITEQEAVPPARVAQKMANGICLYCDKPIGESREIRGVHYNCYQQIRRSSQSFETHERLGLLGPISTGGRPPKGEDKADIILREQAAAFNKQSADDKPKLEETRKRKKKPQ